MQWAASGTQPNAQFHSPGDFRSNLDTAAQRIWDVPDALPCKDQAILLHRVKNTRCSSLHQTAARLKDFLKDTPPLESSSPIFLGSCLEKHLSALKHHSRLGHHSESQHIRRRWVNEVAIFGTCSLLLPLITI